MKVYLVFLTLLGLLATTSLSTAEPVFDGERAFYFLEKQVEFGPRFAGTEGHIACRDYFIETLQPLAEEVRTQPFLFSFGSPAKTATGYNVIARFQPQVADRILLCAHWDTRPWADSDPDPANHQKPVLGGNDGASGVAVLLHIAELIGETPPRVGIDILLFDAEDAGEHQNDRSWAQGSRAFAREYAHQFQPRFGILLDMIGDADLDIYQEVYSLRYARPVVERVWTKAEELGYSEFIPQVGYAVYDDHIPLLEAGIQCINIIDFNYEYWHTVEDTPDKCSAASLETVGRVVTSIIYEE